MRNYFRPLRRKIGVITLTLGILVTGWWVRSFFIWDLIIFSYGRPTWELCESCHGLLVWATNHDSAPMWFPASWEIDKISESKSALDDPKLEWEWRCCGFGVARYPMGPGRIVPYWSIVAPLMLLSAWLLLSRPRAKPAKENSHT